MPATYELPVRLGQAAHAEGNSTWIRDAVIYLMQTKPLSLGEDGPI